MCGARRSQIGPAKIARVNVRTSIVRLKVDTAKEHITDLERELRSFLDTKPYEVGTKRDPQTRKLIYYLTGVKDTPSRVASITGDALQNLRSSLDHLAWQLVLANSCSPGNGTGFPIAESAMKYKQLRARNVQGMSQAAIKAIDAIKPYKGGNDALWRIHELNRIDKHRTVVTVGSAFAFFDVGPLMQREVATMVSFPISLLSLNLAPSDRLCPLKIDDELFIDSPDAEPLQDMPFAFDVAFNERGVVEGESVLPLLQGMATLIDNLISDFDPLLA
jgi:hypothetical protein